MASFPSKICKNSKILTGAGIPAGEKFSTGTGPSLTGRLPLPVPSLVLVSVLFIHHAQAGRVKRDIEWNGNNWAMGCDSPGNDITSFQIPGEECGGKCAQTAGCTHFAWNDLTGGTCWLKQGGATQNDAIPKPGENVICGVL